MHETAPLGWSAAAPALNSFFAGPGRVTVERYERALAARPPFLCSTVTPPAGVGVSHLPVSDAMKAGPAKLQSWDRKANFSPTTVSFHGERAQYHATCHATWTWNGVKGYHAESEGI